MDKRDLLRRMRRILTELKTSNYHSEFLGEEIADLDFDVMQLEKELAKLIDNYMAAQFKESLRKRNKD